MSIFMKKITLAATLLTLAACSFTKSDPYPELAAQELASDKAITSTAASFADKYPPGAVSQCEAMTHEAYEKGTRCYRVVNRNLDRDYKLAYSNADKRVRSMLKRYYTSFSAYYLAPTTPAKKRAAERSYEQLQRRIGS